MILPPVLERFIKVLTATSITRAGGDVPVGDVKSDSSGGLRASSFDLQIVIAFIIIVTELLFFFLIEEGFGLFSPFTFL